MANAQMSRAAGERAFTLRHFFSIHAVAARPFDLRIESVQHRRYQGFVPKLLTRHVDEVAMLTAAGVPARMTAAVVTSLSFAELALAAVLLLNWSRTWPVWLCLVAM